MNRSQKMRKLKLLLPIIIIGLLIIPASIIGQELASAEINFESNPDASQARYIFNFKIDGEIVESWVVPRDDDPEKVDVIPGMHEIEIKLVKGEGLDSRVVFTDVVKFRAKAGHTYWLRATGDDQLDFYVKDMTEDLNIRQGL